MRPDTMRVPPGSRPGDRGFDARCRLTGATRQSPHPGRRPAPSGSRRSTRGEVHDDENAGHRRTAACPRREPRGPARVTSPTDAKPASLTMNLPVRIFWVS